MKNFYLLLKINQYIGSVRLKTLGIYFLHRFGKRYFGIFLDPVLACNLRCRMCYFSDEEKRKSFPHRIFTREELSLLADAFFHRALKLQIGCGAEPSLFPYNRELIRLGKEKKIPYISMTTNANRWKDAEWRELVAAGLDEVTLSLHGVNKESYEYFMTGASYETFCSSWQALTEIKKEYPDFKIRINYTVNPDNMTELSGFFSVFSDCALDILQIRPIQQMGNTAYNNFSWDVIYEYYGPVIEKLRKECSARQITFIAPAKQDLLKEEKENTGSALVGYTFFYISPKSCWQSDFELGKDTYESYARRTHWGKTLLSGVFRSKSKRVTTKKQLNYKIS
ncbi:MAG: radical SAM protein [Candidatus Symbiothrix sp.]|jgi:molybdenum cofactor biosynthesis enzyme MoaA|nr:radical SAM protein [Candidatus Symbiothrix sp.]